jgi:hypothetical protein
MANSDIPPTQTILPMDPPPPSERPTSAMLKGDIDSGRTGDKMPVFDPGLSPLGTDDEAAGTPPSPYRIALARYHESILRWRSGSPNASAAHSKTDGFPFVYVGFIVAAGLVLALGISLVRAP